MPAPTTQLLQAGCPSCQPTNSIKALKANQRIEGNAKYNRKVSKIIRDTNTHTHTRLMALCPGLPGSAGTRKAKPIWILLKQETVRGSGISWAYASLHLAPDR